MKPFRPIFWAGFFLAVLPALGAQEPRPLVCGIALGYAPYQFTSARGEPTGIDADVARLVFQELGVPLVFEQRNWDEVYLGLAHRTGIVDVLCGAEVNDGRKALFEFSSPYYSRTVAVFVRAGSPYQRLGDLAGRIVTGDRGGAIERRQEVEDLRIVQTDSKEVSFDWLKAGKAEAVMAPLEVGIWLSRQRGLEVRVLPERDPGSPVAFAVAKGNRALADRISAALEKLRAQGLIEKVLKRYR